MLEKVLTLGIGFAVSVMIARYLGPGDFGVLAYASSMMMLFGAAGHMGLSGLVVREIVQYPDQNAETLGSTFALKSIGYTAGFLLLVIVTALSEGSYTEEFWVVTIVSLSLLLKPFEVIDLWFQARLEAKYSAISRIIGVAVSACLRVGLVFGGAKLFLFAASTFFQTLLTALAFLIFYSLTATCSFRDWRFSKRSAGALFKQGWVIFLGSIFALIYLKIDQIMLKWILGAEEVGVYAVAATISEAWYFLPTAIVTSLYPRLIELKATDPARFFRRLQQTFDVLFVIAFVVAICVSLSAEILIDLFFGAAYADAALILVIHIWSAIFVFMRAGLSKWILIENALVFSLITQGSGALLNVLLNLFFIPMYGGVGAALATLLSYSVASYFSLLLYRRSRPVFFMMSKAIFTTPLRYGGSLFSK